MRSDQREHNDFFTLDDVQGSDVPINIHTPVACKVSFERVDAQRRTSRVGYEQAYSLVELLLEFLGQLLVLLFELGGILDYHWRLLLLQVVQKVIDIVKLTTDIAGSQFGLNLGNKAF